MSPGAKDSDTYGPFQSEDLRFADHNVLLTGFS